MKAGAALGLLAGLGALNALGGGRNGTGKRFTGLMDMLDGGGAGASGDRFEGGGLLSILGNLFAKPLEAQDNVERIAADTNATKAVTKTLEDMAKGGTLTSRLDGKDGLGTDYNSKDIYGIGRGGEFAGTMPRPDVLGSQQGLLAAQAANEGQVGLGAFGGTKTPMEIEAERRMGLDPFGGVAPPRPEMQYGGRGTYQMPKPDMQYGGRGMLGMPAENVMANVESPVATGASSAAQNEANKAQMRINMAGVTREQYDAMTNAEKRERGLPVGGLDLAFAGADAFAQPMQYSGRGISAGGLNMQMYADMIDALNANDPDFVKNADPETLMDIYSTYVQNAGSLY
jgi:hypothetical protein